VKWQAFGTSYPEANAAFFKRLKLCLGIPEQRCVYLASLCAFGTATFSRPFTRPIPYLVRKATIISIGLPFEFHDDSRSFIPDLVWLVSALGMTCLNGLSGLFFISYPNQTIIARRRNEGKVERRNGLWKPEHRRTTRMCL